MAELKWLLKEGSRHIFLYFSIKKGLFSRVGLFAVLKDVATLLAFGLALTDSILIPVTNTCTGDSQVGILSETVHLPSHFPAHWTSSLTSFLVETAPQPEQPSNQDKESCAGW